MLRYVLLGGPLLVLLAAALSQAFRVYQAWRIGSWSFRGSPMRRAERPMFYWTTTAINVELLALPFASAIIFIRAISH